LEYIPHCIPAGGSKLPHPEHYKLGDSSGIKFGALQLVGSCGIVLQIGSSHYNLLAAVPLQFGGSGAITLLYTHYKPVSFHVEAY